MRPEIVFKVNTYSSKGRTKKHRKLLSMKG